MASNQSRDSIVEYAPWRATGALAFPLLVLLIPTANLIYDRADFRTRYVDEPISTFAILLAVLWFMYALWPAAIRQLRQGTTVTVNGRVLKTADGRSFELRRLRELSIERPFLRHRQVRARFIDPADEAVINTAFQSLQTKLSAADIAERIRRAAADENSYRQ